MVEDRPDHTIDEFEIARVSWLAHEKMLEVSRRATERYGLDPSLTEDLEEAARRHGPRGDRETWDAWDAAVRRFMRAFTEAWRST
ncbi:MAG: hypothetical protein M3N18_06030 [Actinomycetota bacterium]|nr:hypothetical protein [Actinomycetota bacterium]